MSDSDSLYHQLFSHPRMVGELVREFVPEVLTTVIDFSRLQRVNAKFYTSRPWSRRREGDVIWKLPTREGADIYLLVEFQSKIDWWMAVRTQVYQGLLWQQIINEKELQTGAHLSPLLMVVVYNGVSRWNATTVTRQLIALSRHCPLWRWQPQVRYYLLDLSAFSRDELARRTNLAALLFRLEQRPSFEKLKVLVGEVGIWFHQHPDCADLGRLFRELIRRSYIELGVTGPILENLQMFKSNLEGLGKIWIQEWKAEGKAEALVCLLTARFGTVRPSLLKRIRTANLTTLNRWFKRAITASDLPSVFA